MWRFVQISDPHLGSNSDGRWNNNFVCTMMPDVMGCLRRDLARLKPDFILATGDLASQPTRDAMFVARDFMDWLGYPYYPMGGNHDFVVEESRDWFREAFHAHLPSPEMHYSFDHENLHFCVLDPYWIWSDGSLHGYSEKYVDELMQTVNDRPHWMVPETQLAWLEEDLKRNASKPTIIASHYPAVPIPERTLRPGIMNAGELDNGGEVIEVLKRHPQVRAVLSGHFHMNLVVQEGGLTHVITSALPEYPTEYRDVCVYEDRMEIKSVGLSDPSFSTRSLRPGGSFTAGQPCDRLVTISLV